MGRKWMKGMAVCLTLSMFAGIMAGFADGKGTWTDGSVAKAAETTEAPSESATPTAEPSVEPTSEPTATPTASPAPTLSPTPAVPVIPLPAPTTGARGGSKRVRITWSKVSGADGYYIYYRPSTSAAYEKAATISDGSKVEYVKKSLNQNMTYYFRVCAYQKVNDTVVEGNLSSSVSAKTASVAGTSKAAKKYKTKSLFTKSPAYKTYKKMRTKMNYSKSFAIPGMKITNVSGFSCKTMVPQAICHAGSYLLISAYDSTGVDYSVVFVVSKASKSFITAIVLPSKAKVGGMAYDGTNIWISKGSSVACFPYSFITEAVNSGYAYKTLSSYRSVCKVNTTASFMGYYNGTLWVGPFSQSSAKMYGYGIANKTTAPSLSQTYTMTVPSKTQGITFNSDGTMILSRSYRTKKSKSGYISQIRSYLPSYGNAGTSGKVLKNSALAITTMPPLVEGLAVYGSYTYAVFSSTHYSGCKYPVDRVIALKTSKLI